MKAATRGLVAVFAACLVASCAHAPAETKASEAEYGLNDINEQLVLATLWVQTSAEYRALCLQAYNVAKRMVDEDLKIPTDKKRIIIVDGDETTIQANEYEASIIGNNAEYPTGWYDWVASASGPAIPGAVELLNYAASKGIETYYVTNRKVDMEYQGTFDNLRKLGYPNVDEEHVVFRAKGMNDDKAPRLLALENKHHLVLYVGDNLDDFPGGFWDKSIEDRYAATEKARELWGSKYIVLPNPMYGGWEKATKQYKKNLSPAEQNRMRKALLRKWQGPAAKPAAAPVESAK